MKKVSTMTKGEVMQLLKDNKRKVKKADQNLFDSMAYAEKMYAKDEAKVTKKDLISLAKEVIELLGDKLVVPVATPVAENSTKKLSKGVSKKQEVKEEVPSEEDEGEEKAKKKTAKKSSGKTKKAEKDGVIALEETEQVNKAIQMAKNFPETLEVGDSTYELANDLKDMKDLYEALGNDEEIVFAYYWSKRHLKQFAYFNGWLGQPKSFDHDLDLATAIYVSDEHKVCYQVSMYTEAVYTTLPIDLEITDGVRFSCGTEYQIYRAVTK